MICSSKLLLDEKSTKMRQLPGTSDTENSQLNQGPANDTGISGLGLIAEFGLTFLQTYVSFAFTSFKPHRYSMVTTHSLENLLSPNILQPSIQVLNLLYNIRNLALILTLDLTRLTNRQIQVQSYTTQRMARAQPTTCADIRIRLEADTMLAGVRSGESETAGVAAALRNDEVVIIEDFFDGDFDAEVLVNAEGLCLGQVGVCGVVACSYISNI